MESRSWSWRSRSWSWRSTLVGLVVVASCQHHPPQVPVPAEQVAARALGAGAALASIAAAAAEAEGQAGACLAWSATREAAGIAAALLAADMELGEWPALVVDVSSCGELPAGLDIGPLVGVAVDTVLQQVVLVGGVQPCPVVAAVDWVRGVAAAVLQEVETPDGLVELPGVSGECD